MTERKKILLRLDPAVHDALTRWAGDELRSTNAQIEFLLRGALSSAGRLPTAVGRIPRRGRPPKSPADATAAGETENGLAITEDVFGEADPDAVDPDAVDPDAVDPDAVDDPPTEDAD